MFFLFFLVQFLFSFFSSCFLGRFLGRVLVFLFSFINSHLSFVFPDEVTRYYYFKKHIYCCQYLILFQIFSLFSCLIKYLIYLMLTVCVLDARSTRVLAQSLQRKTNLLKHISIWLIDTILAKRIFSYTDSKP